LRARVAAGSLGAAALEGREEVFLEFDQAGAFAFET